MATKPAVGDTSKDDAAQDDLAGKCETGGLSELKKKDDKISLIVEAVREEILEKVKTLTKEKVPKKLEIVGYRVCIVRGYMYYAKIKIPGNSFIQAKILESPCGSKISLLTVHETKTEEEEREYFKLPTK